MMMECPKCGFQQPEDKFCAQCGINVEAYKNKPLPKAKKLWNKLSVQISLTLVLITVLSTVLYIKNNKPNQTPEQLSAVWEKEISQTSSQPQLDAETEQPPANEQPIEESPSSTRNMEPQSLSAQATLNKEDTTQVQDTNSTQPKSFMATLVEAPLRTLEGFGSRVFNQNDVVAIEFNTDGNFQRWLEQSQQNEQLLILQPMKTTNWHNSNFAQFRDQVLITETTGYSTTITLRPNDKNQMQLEIRTANTNTQTDRNRSADEGVQTYTIPVKPNKAYFVFGFFPRPETPMNLPDLESPNRLLSVLNSPDFISGASDLALVIVLK